MRAASQLSGREPIGDQGVASLKLTGGSMLCP